MQLGVEICVAMSYFSTTIILLDVYHRRLGYSVWRTIKAAEAITIHSTGL